MIKCPHISIALIVLLMGFACAFAKDSNPKVLLLTSMGEIEVELFTDKAPVSVSNFLAYVKDGFFTNTLFHRVIPGFMVQGGGFDADMKKKDGKPAIKNEATNRISNKRGTLAYARTNVINSATSQFFINLVDNKFLDHKNTSPQGFGYAVFGKVTRGMKVVDKIAKVKTGPGPYAGRQDL
ncbi:hypothetical protein BVY01_00450, partial [bacterium I07]